MLTVLSITTVIKAKMLEVGLGVSVCLSTFTV